MDNHSVAKVWKSPVTRSAKSVGKMAGKKGDPLAALLACVDYAKAAQHEETDRMRIIAQRDAVVENIRTHRELIEKYFEMYFAERREALHKLFQKLDEGTQGKNDSLVDGALQGIVKIVGESPLKDLDAFQRSMQDPNFKLEL